MHPKTAEMYRKANIDPPLKTEDLVRKRFDDETRGKPRKYRIDQMIKVKQLDKDYIVYNQTILSEDFPGNERTCFETVGIHEEPKFQHRYNPQTGRPEPHSIQGTIIVYDIPATKQNILNILQGKDVVSTDTNFELQLNNVMYGGFVMKEFVDRSFDDLMFKFKNGYYPRETTKPTGDEGEVQQLKKDLITTKGAMKQPEPEESNVDTREDGASSAYEAVEEEQVVNEGQQPDKKELEEQVRKEEEKGEEEAEQRVDQEQEQDKERDRPRVNTSNKLGRFGKKR